MSINVPFVFLIEYQGHRMDINFQKVNYSATLVIFV